MLAGAGPSARAGAAASSAIGASSSSSGSLHLHPRTCVAGATATTSSSSSGSSGNRAWPTARSLLPGTHARRHARCVQVDHIRRSVSPPHTGPPRSPERAPSPLPSPHTQPNNQQPHAPGRGAPALARGRPGHHRRPRRGRGEAFVKVCCRDAPPSAQTADSVDAPLPPFPNNPSPSLHPLQQQQNKQPTNRPSSTS